ncbi:MAG: hypothetical protein KDD56_03865, partial [Bdellovibrionales bacterium]|nr:hypothetical protein [Bdellovibrionales bacterium]
AFIVDENGNHPGPATMILLDEVKAGKWKPNPAVAHAVLGKPETLGFVEQYFVHYVEQLTRGGKYPLMVWPYHAMLGDVDHALVPGIQEALFFHEIARGSQAKREIKGGNPLTENYSVLRPEVLEDHKGRAIAQKNTKFLETLLAYDVLIIAGQAKSHCVAWAIQDLINEIQAQDPELAKKVYLVEDLTSPVVIPGVYDFSDDANAAFQKFADAGMHVVQSTTPIADWPDVELKLP